LKCLLPVRVLPAVWVVLAVAVSMAPAARAFERITLRNGFEMKCDHHAQVEGKTRLFLGKGEDNYIEFGPAEITGVEQLADPPVIATAKPSEEARAAQKKGKVAHSPSEADASLSVADLHELLTRAGNAHDLDVDLLASLVKAESGGNTRAVSRAGAQGLTQLMPQTASSLNVTDSFNPEENLRGGSTYLDTLLTRYHENLALALAAYNAGPAAVDKFGGIPPYHETRVYVAQVIHEFNRRVLTREAQSGRAASPLSKVIH
jgi:soluble lytic murein transglycosylase-like protein